MNPDQFQPFACGSELLAVLGQSVVVRHLESQIIESTLFVLAEFLGLPSSWIGWLAGIALSLHLRAVAALPSQPSLPTPVPRGTQLSLHQRVQGASVQASAV